MEHHHHQQQQQLESDSQVAVQSLLSEALTYDGLGRPKEAYAKYCESMDYLVSILKTFGQSRASERRRRLSSQSLVIAQNCLSRMTELVGQIPPSSSLGSLSSGGEEEPDDYLAIISDDDRERKTSEPASAHLSVDEHRPSIDVSTLSEEDAIRRIKEFGPVSQAQRQNETLRQAHQQRYPAQQPNAMALNLKLARKLYENMVMAKQQEQSLIQQVKQASSRQQLESDLVGELLQRRQQRNLSINERFAELMGMVTEKVRGLQMVYRNRVEEEAWLKRMRKTLTEIEGGAAGYLIEPILNIMGQEGHPLSAIVRDFLSSQRHQFTAAPTEERLERLFAEIHLFTGHILDLLDHNHPDLRLAEQHQLNLKLSVQHFVFTTPVASGYWWALRRVYASEDERFERRCASLGWTDLVKTIGIKPKFLPCTDVAPLFVTRDGEGYFQEAIEELKTLTLKATPFLKMTVLVNTCSLICQAVEKLATDPEQEDLSIGSEDLLLLLSYAMIRARPSSIHSEFAFVSELVPEEILRGESGYVLATVHTCINHVLDIEA